MLSTVTTKLFLDGTVAVITIEIFQEIRKNKHCSNKLYIIYPYV